jgi:hypothetical protein
MSPCRLISSAILLVTISVGLASAQQKVKLGENAALRYWSAFAQMQDAAITDEQAKQLTTILDGTAPYDDSKYKDLVEKNRPALETLARATTLPNCDWGVDYQLGTEAPVEYVRKALALGRLNVLYTFHLLIAGDKDRAVGVLAAGLRFAPDAAKGGTLFATLVAKTLLVQHLRAAEFALQVAGLSAAQRLVLQKAVTQLGPDGLDWQSAVKQELEIPLALNSQASAALARIMTSYLNTLNNASELPVLQKMIANAPSPLPDIIPSPKRLLEEKHDLIDKLMQARSRLR